MAPSIPDIAQTPQGHEGGAPAPLHVAIIMDGNGRWATQRGWPRLAGHRKGAEQIKKVVQAAPDLGIRYMTIYAFSTENWKRSTQEVLGLMKMFRLMIKREAAELSRQGVELRFIGDRTPLDPLLRETMDAIETRTKGNSKLTLAVAINYGGRDELKRAAQSIARDVAAGKFAADEVDEAMISSRLDSAGMPDPDLVIRSSGETRTSNFLPWQAAYSEYEFTPTLWPDFTPDELSDILDRFAGRERRFGGVAS
ncbi:polyprenyl diphosphate synthase [Thioclava sp. JE_KL1]|uniref:polyprenyl diphosphate synthase n=1 Tax=Thioclava sp. JE_KL1 TaxID=2651187 RepID=UPI00128E1CAA|nr:polyprenyl diphosphate synthase [Thioclava sp. JE_KL1]MPQ93894.1 di-trans,poly-cis-decaprenylcistransferase [Thioclava sp. JE_KL1]